MLVRVHGVCRPCSALRALAATTSSSTSRSRPSVSSSSIFRFRRSFSTSDPNDGHGQSPKTDEPSSASPSSSSQPSPSPKPNPRRNSTGNFSYAPWFNYTAAHYRFGLFYSHIGFRLGTVFPLFLACRAIGLGGPELAFGWMAARTTRRFQRPVALGVAGGFATLFPALQGFSVSALLLPPAVTLGANGQQRSLIDQNVEELKQIGFGDKAEKLRRGVNFIEGPIDKFGFAYLVTSKAFSIGTILGCAYALKHGVDLQSWLAQYGLVQTIGENFGPLAAAVCINAPLWPIHVFGATITAPRADKLRKFFAERHQARFDQLHSDMKQREKEKRGGDDD